MKKYRVKGPIIVEAIRFDSSATWPDCVHSWKKEEPRPRDMSWGYIETDEGRTHVLAGDWIIKGVTGRFTVCKPDIFDKIYEAVV